MLDLLAALKKLRRPFHIGQTRYWKIEKGYTTVRPDERRALARVLRMPEEVIFPGECVASATSVSAAEAVAR